MSTRTSAGYGSWPSPVAADEIAREGRVPEYPTTDEGHVWWQESRPDQGGRVTVMRMDAAGTCTEALPAPWNARSLVHGYGGRSYLAVPGADGPALVFCELSDQRLYRYDPADGGAPVALTPEPDRPGALRYADMIHRDGTIIAVHEHDHADGVRRSLVALPLDGSAATTGQLRELAAGADFYAAPALSPDGARLAWISWSHPRMPWDGTELRVGTLPDTGPLGGVYTLKGNVTESVLAPRWRDAATLYCLSDWSGWWNLYEVGLRGPAMPLYPAEEEFTPPPWRLGATPYCVLDDGRLVVVHGHADLGVAILDPADGELRPVDSPLRNWRDLACDGRRVVGIAGGPDTPEGLARLDPDTGETAILRSGNPTPPDPAYLPQPRTETIPGRYGRTVHVNIYPPRNPDARAEGPAPYVVWVHGGPTGVSSTTLHLDKVYFTSRGIGIVDVNYGGSAGHGRSYRQRLNKQWGVVDVEDAVAAAQALVDQGIADPDRLAVRGGSSGGLTALLALTHDTFACGVSYYGVTDLRRLAAETHDFESRYLDTLIGPLPGYQATYAERSPINRAGQVTAPVLLLQGADDPVVPPSQAGEFVHVLGENGIRHAYVEFPGEAHGFRAAASRTRALEAELAFYAAVFGFTAPGIDALPLRDTPPEPEATPDEPPEPEQAPPAADTAEAHEGAQ